MRLTVIGSSSPFPKPDNPCSCYLVEHQGRRLLLDCGAGALAYLTRTMDIALVDAVLLSHFHGDHMSDLLVLKYAVDLALERGTRREPLPVYCPPEPAAMVELVTYKQAVVPRLLAPGETFCVGDIAVTTAPTTHPLPGLCYRLSAGPHSLCFTGDTELTDEVVAAAAGATVLLAEATYAAVRTGISGHMSGSDAGRLAQAAQAGTLIITHVSAYADEQLVVQEAQREFSGPIMLANPGLSLEPAAR